MRMTNGCSKDRILKHQKWREILHSEVSKASFQGLNNLYSVRPPWQNPSRPSHYEHSLSKPILP